MEIWKSTRILILLCLICDSTVSRFAQPYVYNKLNKETLPFDDVGGVTEDILEHIIPPDSVCYIHLVNFQGLYLKHVQFPIVLYQPLNAERISLDEYTRLFLPNSNLFDVSKIGPLPNNTKAGLPNYKNLSNLLCHDLSSRFLPKVVNVRWQDKFKICNGIHDTYFMKVRRITCQIYIGLQPQTNYYSKDVLKYQLSGYSLSPFEFQPGSMSYQSPSRPKLHLLIRFDTTISNLVNNYQQDFLYYQRHTTKSGFIFRQELNYFILLEALIKMAESRPVVSIRQMKACMSCTNFTSEYFVEEVNIDKLKQIYTGKNEFSSTGKGTMIRVFVSTVLNRHTWMSLQKLPFHQRLDACPEAAPSRNSFYRKPFFHLWATVFMNMSVSDFHQYSDCNRKKPIGIPFSNFPIQLRVSATAMDPKNYIASISRYQSVHLLTCGQRGIEGLAFSELLQVYETRIWIGIIFLNLVLAYLLKFANKSSSYARNLASLFQSLLEQGDAFPTNILKIPSTSYVLAGFMLAGIVLSNAYKNTNVYNMILPRKPILFENLSQLLETGYKVYSRGYLDNIHFDKINETHLKNLVEIEFCLSNPRAFNISEVCSSKFHLVHFGRNGYLPLVYRSPNGFKLDSYLKQLSYMVKHNATSIATQKLVEQDVLYPDALNVMRNLFVRARTLHNFPRISKYTARDMYESIEEEMIVESVEQCKKTAFVVTLSDGRRIVRTVRNKSVSAYLVKEVYFHLNTVYQVIGIMFPHIYNRFKAIYQESGIWSWCANLIPAKDGHNINSFQIESQSVSKAKIGGNILVIFVVLGMGLLNSLLLYLWETKIYWGTYIKMFLLYTRALIKLYIRRCRQCKFFRIR